MTLFIGNKRGFGQGLPNWLKISHMAPHGSNTDLDRAMNSLSHGFEHKWIISCCYCSALQVIEEGAKKRQINYNVWWCTQFKKIILQYSRNSFLFVTLLFYCSPTTCDCRWRNILSLQSRFRYVSARNSLWLLKWWLSNDVCQWRYLYWCRIHSDADWVSYIWHIGNKICS